jgi:hypothetical protein
MKRIIMGLLAIVGIFFVWGACARAEDAPPSPPAENAALEQRFEVKAGVWNVTPRGSISVSGPAVVIVDAKITSLDAGVRATGYLRDEVRVQRRHISDSAFSPGSPCPAP